MTGASLLMIAAFLGTLLVLGAISGLVVLVGGGGHRKRRLQRAAGKRPSSAGSHRAVSLRRDEVDGRFRALELALRRLLPGRDKLRARLARTGLRISLGRYIALCLLVAGAFGLVGLSLLGPGKWPAIAAGAIAAGWILPRGVVGALAARRVKRFLTDLPDAIDVIVRGLKSGLPITETIAAVSNDFDGPVGQEFKLIDDHVRVGTSLEEALWLTANRLDIPEFNFLAISVGVQRETGGNLTETLANLSTLLRRRQQMRLKIRALSSEARASAYILGALPFLMAALLYSMNPDYMGRMFTESQGHVMLGIALATETLGALVMFKMVKFEI